MDSNEYEDDDFEFADDDIEALLMFDQPRNKANVQENEQNDIEVEQSQDNPRKDQQYYKNEEPAYSQEQDYSEEDFEGYDDQEFEEESNHQTMQKDKVEQQENIEVNSENYNDEPSWEEQQDESQKEIQQKSLHGDQNQESDYGEEEYYSEYESDEENQEGYQEEQSDEAYNQEFAQRDYVSKDVQPVTDFKTSMKNDITNFQFNQGRINDENSAQQSILPQVDFKSPEVIHNNQDQGNNYEDNIYLTELKQDKNPYNDLSINQKAPSKSFPIHKTQLPIEPNSYSSQKSTNLPSLPETTKSKTPLRQNKSFKEKQVDLTVNYSLNHENDSRSFINTPKIRKVFKPYTISPVKQPLRSKYPQNVYGLTQENMDLRLELKNLNYRISDIISQTTYQSQKKKNQSQQAQYNDSDSAFK